MNQAEWLDLARENLRKQINDVRRIVMQRAPQALYGILASSVILPILMEASQGQFPLNTILGTASGIGLNFITDHLLQIWRDGGDQALQDQLSKLATNNDEVREQLNRLIKLLEPERIIQPMLNPEERKQFSATLNVVLSGNWEFNDFDIEQHAPYGINFAGNIDSSQVYVNLNRNLIPHSVRSISYILDDHTQNFIGRDVELQVLGHFARQRTPGYLVIEAPPGFGKTALLANFILHLQTNSDVEEIQLFHYIVQQEGRHNTATAFMQEINSQLLKHLDDSNGVYTERDSLRNQLRKLWTSAVDRAPYDTPLLLLIDNLDQMVRKDISFILELLTYLGEFVHIICTTQSYDKLKGKVSREHPLRKSRKILLERLDASDLEAMQSHLDLPEHHLITRGIVNSSGKF